MTVKQRVSLNIVPDIHIQTIHLPFTMVHETKSMPIVVRSVMVTKLEPYCGARERERERERKREH